MNKIDLRSIVSITAMVLLAIGMLGLAGGLFVVVFAGTKAAIVTFVYGSIFAVFACVMFAGLEN